MTNTTPRNVAYLRVSTQQQADDEKTGFDRQEEKIRIFAEANGLELDGFYREAISGTETDRPILDGLIAELPPGSVILVESIDRFTRDIMKGLPYLLDILAANVDIIDVSMNTSMNTELNGSPWQKFLLKFKMLVAEFQRDELTDRLQKAREQKAEERGYYKAGPDAIYEPDFRERLRYLRDQGKTMGQIAALLNREGVKPAVKEFWTAPMVSSVIRGGRRKRNKKRR